MNVQLARIAYARSGEKGDSINIGVVAREPRFYATLLEQVTAARVREHFSDICRGEVRRYELSKLNALNLVLERALDGGATSCLRLDSQGKTACDGLMLLEVSLPDDLADELA